MDVQIFPAIQLFMASEESQLRNGLKLLKATMTEETAVIGCPTSSFSLIV